MVSIKKRVGRAVVRGVLAAVMVSGLLAACQHDKGDPVEITRNFMLAIWAGDVEQVEKLTCKDEEWRAVTRQWAEEEGDPAVVVDAEHLTFEIQAKTDKQVELVMSGVVTFKHEGYDPQISNLDEKGVVRITLIDQNGWKVCGVE